MEDASNMYQLSNGGGLALEGQHMSCLRREEAEYMIFLDATMNSTMGRYTSLGGKGGDIFHP